MDPFATLGLPRRYDLDPNELERNYRQLQKALHPDKHVAGTASQRRLALGKAVEVNEAYRTLRDELKRAEALLAVLRGDRSLVPAKEPSREVADPELLTEVMELREALGDAKSAGDATQVHALAAKVQRLHDAVREQLTREFAAVSAQADPAGLATFERLATLVSRLKYYQRFLDEVRAFEENA